MACFCLPTCATFARFRACVWKIGWNELTWDKKGGHPDYFIPFFGITDLPRFDARCPWLARRPSGVTGNH
jgi:hypothetical protein